jgi:CDP-paratose 2-epimerase
MNSTIVTAARPPIANHVLITGGAGFIGTNLAHRLLLEGQPVIILDNLSRNGVRQNLDGLKRRFGALVKSIDADIRDRHTLSKLLPEVSAVFHFAAQVAVTASLEAPREDFEVNACGTLNLLETLKGRRNPPPLIFTSTNKVYGALDWMPLDEGRTRYVPRDPEIRRRGINEACPISFRSPYGCSKGAADQYVQDYANSFNLQTLVFRMSCIYGTHQYGTEDQGWVAHFLSQCLNGRRITIYGDGKQVRDLLYIDDLIDALFLAHKNIVSLSGRVFNIGGGPLCATSLLELLTEVRDLGLGSPQLKFADWRTGDQQYYVSDCASFRSATGWRPRVGIREGITRLHQWLIQSAGIRRSISLTA